MAVIDWLALFDDFEREAGASDREIARLLDDISRPLDGAEVEFTQRRLGRNPFPPGTPEHAAYTPPDPGRQTCVGGRPIRGHWIRAPRRAAGLRRVTR